MTGRRTPSAESMLLYKTEIFGCIMVACFTEASADGVGYDYFVDIESDHTAQQSWGRQIFFSIGGPDGATLEYLYLIHNKILKHIKGKIRKRTTRLLRNVRYKKIWDAQDGACYLCRLPLTGYDCTIDHVVPVSRGGKDSLRNVLLTHSKCNHAKGDRMPTKKELEYLEEVTVRVKKITYLKYHQ